MDKFNQYISEGMLFTDQYQLTMSQVYYRMGLHEQQVQFEHFFRDYPNYGSHKAGYCINAGLEWLVDWMQHVQFTGADIRLLADQRDSSGKAMFEMSFLKWLQNNVSFTDLHISAIPEGRVVHPNVPLTVVQGPLVAAQILETALLNQLNYQILIATKASRIKLSGQGQLLLEFGARRGHDRGANAGVRAALIGGADFSSNVGISHVLGFPPKGTHAHSMVQLFLAMGMSELDAFRAYAESYPDNCILLVDTINTLESGIPNAIRVFEEMKRKGQQPLGIRLDSGDLAYLSIKAAVMLNNAGFENVSIVLSNDLDELKIWQIITQIQEEAPSHDLDPDALIRRLVYGVGTRLITSAGFSALGGVYKLVAVNKNGNWLPVIKISENLHKVPNPGSKKVWRIYDERDRAIADLMSADDEHPGEMSSLILRHPNDVSKFRKLMLSSISAVEPLLIDIMQDGKITYEFPSIEKIREVRDNDINKLDAGVKRLIEPHIYHVSLTQKLWEMKQKLIQQTTNQVGEIS
ncbi:nicotinate phosphoribosyltransferase [candidate division KSB1 bacterium]|nr:nicotinate phosphoribosyltransferase [candidate division KSB1 bacterium]